MLTDSVNTQPPTNQPSPAPKQVSLLLPVSLSILSLVISIGAVAAPFLLNRSSPVRMARVMTGVGSLFAHFDEKQIEIMLRIADKAGMYGAVALTEQNLMQYEAMLDKYNAQKNYENSLMGTGDQKKYENSVKPDDNQMAQNRNAQRRSDVNTLLNAVYQYSIDNNHELPPGITSSPTAICRSEANVDCTGLVNLSALTNSYIMAVPSDPQVSTGTSTNYIIMQADNRITIQAPGAELGTSISVTR